MSGRSSTPPKRRASGSTDRHATSIKASRMSATAAEFTPASSTTPASASALADPVAQQLKSDKDGIMSSTGQSEATKRAMADAVAASRVTKPLPGSRRTGVGADFVPKQAEVPKGAEAKEGTRRLIVVLSQVGLLLGRGGLRCWSSMGLDGGDLMAGREPDEKGHRGMSLYKEPRADPQACLEAYKVSSGSASKTAPGKEAKYALLNCDDHQGILAKTGRDIADARPDITHQVSPCRCLLRSF